MGEIFDDTTLAAAMLDRLLHRSAVINMTGDSYRMQPPGTRPQPFPKGHRASSATELDYFGRVRNNAGDVHVARWSGVKPDDLDELVRALSNATRRRILQLCANRYVPAGDIAADIDLALASVSEHLKVLRKTGLVELERTGTKWMYRTNQRRVDEVVGALIHDLPPPPTSPPTSPPKGPNHD